MEQIYVHILKYPNNLSLYKFGWNNWNIKNENVGFHIMVLQKNNGLERIEGKTCGLLKELKEN